MKLVRGFALIVGAATAALAFSAGPASAHGYDDDDYYDDDYGSSSGMHSSDNIGLLNGNQAHIPVHIPINVCGNSIAVLGLANSNAGCVND